MATSNTNNAVRLTNIIPKLPTERPRCTIQLLKQTKSHEAAYKQDVTDIVRRIRNVNRYVPLTEVVAVVRTNDDMKTKIRGIYRHLQWIGKNGCHVTPETKWVLRNLIQRIAQTTQRSTRYTKDKFSSARYTASTRDDLLDLIVDTFILPLMT